MTAANVQVLHQPINTPSKLADDGASTGRSQRDRRYTATFWDQHVWDRSATHRLTATRYNFPRGRPWWGEREFSANKDVKIGGRPIPDAFVGPVTPGEHVLTESGAVDRAACLGSSWEAPWLPFQKYFRFNYHQQTIAFDYARMRMDELAQLRKYWEAAAKLGTQLNIPVHPQKLPHPQIILALGEPSRMYKIAEAAMAGDPWLLGFLEDPNMDLYKILQVHPLAGYSFDHYEPETVQTAQEEKAARVETVLAAPPSADLLEMIAKLTAQVAALEAKGAEKLDEPKRRAKEAV